MAIANDRATEIKENNQKPGQGGVSGADYQLGRLLDESLAAAKLTAAREFGPVSIEENGQTCAS